MQQLGKWHISKSYAFAADMHFAHCIAGKSGIGHDLLDRVYTRMCIFYMSDADIPSNCSACFRARCKVCNVALRDDNDHLAEQV